MELTLDALKEMGAFTGAPVKKEIVWQQRDVEHRADVFVRRLSYHSTVAELLSISGKSDAVAGRIAACICDAEGNPIFTAKDITGEANLDRGPLDGALTISLLKAIAEVNGLGESTPKSK